MRILVDENIPGLTVRALEASGNDVRDLRGTAEEGMSDEDVWNLAQREERLLITTDKGFVRRRREPHHGMLVVRLRKPNRMSIHRAVLQALGQLPGTEWSGRLVVVRDQTLSTWP